jgi:DNA-binding NarL/FixJ family response regulator
MLKFPKIILANKHPLVRSSLKLLLNNSGAHAVVGEAGSIEGLMEVVRSTTADLLLLDENVLEEAPAVSLVGFTTLFPGLRLIVLYNRYTPEMLTSAFAGGAHSVLSIDCDFEFLLLTIKQVLRHGYYFSKELSVTPEGHLMQMDKLFSFREIEIIKCVCNGDTNREIAQKMQIATSTVDFYKSKIYSKASCNNVTGLLKFAIRKGLVPLY